MNFKAPYKFLFLLLLGLHGLGLSAQGWSLEMELLVTNDGKKMSGGQVEVFRNGSKVETVSSDAKGRAIIKMQPDGVYTLSVSGRNLISKKIEVNTKNVGASLTEDAYYQAEVNIFPKVDGLNYDILKEPIGKVAFDPSFGAFVADEGYTKQRQRALQQLTDDYYDKKAEAAAKEKENQKLYDAAIKIADKAFSAEDWELAEAEYKKAAAYMPIETYPSFQLAELETKLIKIRATNAKYDQAMQAAQAAEAESDFPTAISEYKRASGYKPDEEVPKAKITEIQSRLANEAKIEQNYLAAIEKADNALSANDLQTAKSAFTEATEIKPSESYPKNKLAEINDILSKQEAKETQYAAAIKTGDDGMAVKNYEGAKAAYQEALDIKPGESYPTEQIQKALSFLAEAAKIEQNYLAAIEAGDNALAAKTYEEAKTAYSEAAQLKPNKTYPQDKIKEIDQFLAANAAKEKQYQNKIAAADKAMAGQAYEEAKTNYQAASELKPTEAYPKEKLTEVAALIAAAAEKEQQYADAVSKADAALAAESYDEAKTAYTAASQLKPEEKYPQDKLAEIGTILLGKEKLEEDYKQAIAAADAAFAANQFDDAKKSYLEASGFKPSEAYPQDKLKEIDEKLAAAEEMENNYAAAVAEGDAALQSDDLDKAEAAYTKALSIKPAETHPQTQLAAIDEKRAGLAAAAAAAEKLAAEYAAAIKLADETLEKGELASAKAAYEQAQSIKSDESYPAEKISEIEGLMAAEADRDANYQAAIAAGDQAFQSEDFEAAKSKYTEAQGIKSSESYPAEQLAAIEAKLAALADAAAAAEKLEADYQASMQEGDKQLAASAYDEAITAYTAAGSLKPEESLPKQKIEEANQLKATAAEAKAEEERLAKLQADYDAAVQKADADLAAKNLESAKTNYQAALALKADESYPQTKIDEINTQLADAAAQDEAYAAAIASADALFGEENWDGAKAKYAEASSIKSAEQYPKDKLNEIEVKIAALASEQEAIRLKQEQEAAKQAEYEAAVAEADAAFEAGSLDEAEAAYGKALSIKAEETYPQSQLAAIDAKRLELASQAEQEAAAAAQAKIDAEYQTALEAADAAFEAGSLDEAEAGYGKALSIKAAETYPQSQLAAIDAKRLELASQAEQEAAAVAQAKIDAEYQTALEAADAAFEAGSLDEAEAGYGKALSIKAAETYPQSQLAAIDAKRLELAGQAEQEAAAAAQAKLDADYLAAIALADQAFEASEWDQAETAYMNALSLKASETYPQSQLALIDEKRAAMADAAAAEAAAAAAEKKAAELEANYLAAIAEADAAFEAENWDQAEAAYVKALSFKPAETYPQSQLGMIDSKREAIALQNQEAAALAAEEARKAKLEQEYLMAIEKGDQALAAKSWDEAIAAFQSAQQIKPAESYPPTKIQEIEALILAEKEAAEMNAAQMNENYQRNIGLADQAFSARSWDEATQLYETAQSFKPGESYPAEQIAEIQRILEEKKRKEEEKKRALAAAANLEEAFSLAISKGDAAFESQDYAGAKAAFQDAQNLKPEEQYPIDRIAAIDAILAKELAEKRKAQEAADLESQYYALIQSADDAYDKGGLSTAKRDYSQALAIKPSESYPQSQLDKINAELDKRRLLAEEDSKKTDEPIQIQTGPRASITSDAEAEIDRMYREMWDRKHADKNTILDASRQEVLDSERAKRESQADRRENQMAQIRDYEVSLQSTQQGSEEYYMQNYEVILEQEEDLKTEDQSLTRESERKRNEKYEDEGELAKQIMAYNTDRNLEITEGKKEQVEEDIADVIAQEKEYSTDQDDRILENHEEKVEVEKSIQTFNRERSEENLERTKDLPATQLKEWQDTENVYESGGEERTDLNTEDVFSQRQSQLDFHNARKESFKSNQEAIEQTTEELKQETIDLEAAAENRRQENKVREFYEGESQPREDAMAADYPQGVSEEIIENDNNSTTIRRVVVNGTEVDIYEKTLYTWGGIFYTKNGDNITKEIWDANSK